MSEILTCPWCNKPRATRADWERYEGGEGTHLCWADPRCEMDGDEEIVVALRATLARETERAERAEREQDEARAAAERCADAATDEIERWQSRALAAESERDRLRESLKSEQAWAKEYHDEWQKAELAARNAVGHADSLRRGAINWRERAWTAERKLDALSHLGTGAGRRAG